MSLQLSCLLLLRHSPKKDTRVLQEKNRQASAGGGPRIHSRHHHYARRITAAELPVTQRVRIKRKWLLGTFSQPHGFIKSPFELHTSDGQRWILGNLLGTDPPYVDFLKDLLFNIS